MEETPLISSLEVETGVKLNISLLFLFLYLWSSQIDTRIKVKYKKRNFRYKGVLRSARQKRDPR